MDPIRNPYAPGAGQRPPELAHRARGETQRAVRSAVQQPGVAPDSLSADLVQYFRVGSKWDNFKDGNKFVRDSSFRKRDQVTRTLASPSA